MEDFQEELYKLLSKHNASIEVEEEQGFLYLNIVKGDETKTVDTGYRDLTINEHNCRK